MGAAVQKSLCWPNPPERGPRWIGLITDLAAAFVGGVDLMLIDWFAHPPDLEFTFTWKGRLGVVCFAGMLVWLCTQVLEGKTGYE